jgi:hypothetical protein
MIDLKDILKVMMDIRLLHLGLGDKFGASYIVELILASGISDSGIIKPKFVECSS